MGERYPSGHHNRESRRSERSNSEIVGRCGPEDARCTPPGGAGRHGRRGSPAALLAAVALVLAAALHLATGASWASAAAGTVNAGDLGPIAGIIDDLIEELEKIEKELEEAHAEVGTHLGPLVDPMLSHVAGHLSSVEGRIDVILDPHRYPSLSPADAGSVDPNVTPTTLPEYATACLDLIREALDELTSAPSSVDDVVGTKIQTIKDLLDGYRAEAGI